MFRDFNRLRACSPEAGVVERREAQAGEVEAQGEAERRVHKDAPNRMSGRGLAPAAARNLTE